MSETSLPLRPASSEELASAIAQTAARRAQARLTGSGSLTPAAEDAGRPVQTISTLRASKVLEHAVADMSVTVQAGVTLEKLQQTLAWHKQWLPVDPPAVNGRNPMQRTLGGLIASNALGPLRLGMGDWRQFILGMRWVDASGTLIKSGGQTVKNVAGYATHRLLIGSRGALGTIAEVTLRTYARPADEQCVIFYCAGPAEAEALIAETLLADVAPAYVQCIGRQSLQKNILDLPAPPPGQMVVVVGFLGEPDVCAGQVQQVRALPAARGCESLAQTAAQAGRLRLWMTSEPAGTLGVRVATASSNVAATIARLETLAQGRAWLVAEAAAGLIRASFSGAAAEAFVPSLREAGEVQIIYGAPAQANTTELGRQLKHELDPQQVFPALP